MRSFSYFAGALLALSGCSSSDGASGGDPSGGGDDAPGPVEHRAVSFSDGAGAVAPNAILNNGYSVVGVGSDAVFSSPVRGDIYGTSSVALTRMTEGGEVRWSKEIALPENAFAGQMQADGDGVVFVAGQDATIYVVRVDAKGGATAKAFEQAAGTTGPLSQTTPLTLARLDDGGLLVGFGGGAMRLDAHDKKLWSSGVGTDSVTRVAVLDDGFAFVGGIAEVLVSRTDKDGKPKWAKHIPYEGTTHHAGIAPDGDDLVVITGTDMAKAVKGVLLTRFSGDGAKVSQKAGSFFDPKKGIPISFTSGVRVVTDPSGGVWGSVFGSSGGVGVAIITGITFRVEGTDVADVSALDTSDFYATADALIGITGSPSAPMRIARAPYATSHKCASPYVAFQFADPMGTATDYEAPAQDVPIEEMGDVELEVKALTAKVEDASTCE